MNDWQGVVKDTTPKQTYCGPIYEPRSPLDRPNESFAISDMREVVVAEPHYHTDETEIYFVLSGTGLTVVGGEELQLKEADVIVTPPETAHFTIPKENLVMIVINTPPFNPENNIGINAAKPEVRYDHEQYMKFTACL
jgi:mannose-6-phosphate isomerase-like protein (cupin superfamily)